MKIDRLITRLDVFPAALHAVVAGVNADEARWRPDGGRWSITEIIGHLVDEEELDFPVRIRLTLTDPVAPWPPIDPERTVEARNHRESELSTLLATFAAARKDQMSWLCGQRDANWSAAHQHPKLGVLRAGDLLAAWVAHDQLHLRQIAKRIVELTERDAPGFSAGYAGELT